MTSPVPENPHESLPSAIPALSPEAQAEEAARAEWQAIQSRVLSLQQQGRNGAKWFYWVAGLSLVNSAILLSGGTTFFVIGLGVTLFADVLATGVAQQSPEIGQVAKVVAFGFDLFVASVVVAFGWLAAKRHLAIFAVGMGLYLLDGVIFLLVQDWMSVGFHAFALFCMWSGFRAYRQAAAIEAAIQQASAQELTFAIPDGGPIA